VERVQFCTEPLGCRAERTIRYMSVALRRDRVSVAEQAPYYLKAQAARNEMGRVGMSIVV
jgi:hypothetical protein